MSTALREALAELLGQVKQGAEFHGIVHRSDSAKLAIAKAEAALSDQAQQAEPVAVGQVRFYPHQMAPGVDWFTGVNVRNGALLYQGAAPQAPEAGSDAKDAARYRWLRDSEWEMFEDRWLSKVDLYGQGPEDLDEFIDAALAAQAGSKTP